MANSVAKIAANFATHADDGEFALNDNAIVGAMRHNMAAVATATQFVYSTKPQLWNAVVSTSADLAHIAILGRYGLPHGDDPGDIRNLIGDRPIGFLGDCDPPDLLIFAWLKAHFHPRPISHLGVNDRLMAALQFAPAENLCCPCSSAELQAFSLLNVHFPDTLAAVGEKCGMMLSRGVKIEVEAVISAVGNPAAVLRAALN